MNIDEKIYKAELCKKENNWEDAIKLYREIVIENDSINNLSKLGWCLSRNENYQDAIECFQKLAMKEPKMAKWKYMIGYQYYSQKRWKEAIRYFEETLNIKPDYFIVKYRVSYAYIQLAGIYKKLTKPEFWKALGHIKECHELWENFNDKTREKEQNIYFDINFLHGKILMDLPNHRIEAIKYFKNALKIKNDDICKYNLSKTYYLMGDYQNAKTIIPNIRNYYVIELNAYIDAKLGNYDIAINDVKKLLRQRNRDYLYAFLAEVYLLKNDKEEAIRMIRKAIQANKKSHKNYFILAKIYESFGLYNTALEFLDKAKKIKLKMYNSEYKESIELEIRIKEKITSNYKEDIFLLKKLKQMGSTDDYQIGKIENYNKDKGYGFIKFNRNKVFFHITDCKFKLPQIGDKVKFRLNKDTDKEKATSVMKI